MCFIFVLYVHNWEFNLTCVLGTLILDDPDWYFELSVNEFVSPTRESQWYHGTHW